MAPNMAKENLETETSKESEANKTRDAPARASVRERLKQFTWAWFSMTMSTGALAAVLYNTPNKFSGLLTIGKIFFILDLVFFCLFVSAITARFVLEPSALPRSLHHPTESLFFGTFWVSIALILQNAQFYGHQNAGAWLVAALRVCFWLYVGLIFLVGIFQYHTLFVKERLQVPSMMPAWILPIYPFLVAGPLAGVLLESQPESHSISMLIGGVMFQGLGWMVSVFMYTIFIIRLMSSDLPPPSMRAGMHISVGPASYTSLALTTLGSQAQRVLPADFLGVTSVPVGDLLKVLGVFSGIFIWLLGFWFSMLSTLAVIAGLKKFSFDLTWWAFIFPNAGLTLAAIQIGKALDSPGINDVTSAMTTVLVILWLVVAGANIKAFWQKRILMPGKDEIR